MSVCWGNRGCRNRPHKGIVAVGMGVLLLALPIQPPVGGSGNGPAFPLGIDEIPVAAAHGGPRPDAPTLSFPSGWSAEGEAAGDRFGFSLANAGDVDGDGYADVLVGAPAADSRRGRVYLYLGSPHGPAASPAWSAAGENEGDEFGRAVAGAGDVNGDGYADVLVAAPKYPPRFPHPLGRIYLYLGSPAGLARAPTWKVVGDYGLGHAVAGAGDVDGDSYPDVIAGYAHETGEPSQAFAYLSNGGSGGRIVLPRQLQPDREDDSPYDGYRTSSLHPLPVAGPGTPCPFARNRAGEPAGPGRASRPLAAAARTGAGSRPAYRSSGNELGKTTLSQRRPDHCSPDPRPAR